MYWKFVIMPFEGKGGGDSTGIMLVFCVFFKIDETSTLIRILPYANYYIKSCMIWSTTFYFLFMLISSSILFPSLSM